MGRIWYIHTCSVTMLKYYHKLFTEIGFHCPILKIYKIQDKIHGFCEQDWNFEKFGFFKKYKKLLCEALRG